MGVSDYHIRKIKKVSESRIICPECGKKTLYINTETGDYEDFDLSYCSECKIFFEYDDGYFTENDTEGLEKLQIQIKQDVFKPGKPTEEKKQNNKDLTKQEKYSIDIKDIAKRVKQQLQKEFPSCVFSVTIERYSGGQSLSVSLMKSNFKVIRDFKDIPEMAFFKLADHHYTKEQIEKMQSENYHQVNHYSFRDDFDPDNWNNGVFLTEQGHNLFKRVAEIVNYYNYDNSDIQTDYFDVNFYFHLNIGQWNKPYILEVKP